MAFPALCPGCLVGNHSSHVATWAPSPFGVFGGPTCTCQGDCAQSTKENTMNAAQQTVREERLTDELRQAAYALRQALDQRDEARRQVQAARELAEDWTNDFEPAHSFGQMLDEVLAGAADLTGFPTQVRESLHQHLHRTGAVNAECAECQGDASDGPVGSDGHGACADCAGSAD